MRAHILTLFALITAATVWANSPPHHPTSGSAVTYVCSARSIIGRRYTAEGPDKVLAQEEAMRKCEADSWRCYPTGCKP